MLSSVAGESFASARTALLIANADDFEALVYSEHTMVAIVSADGLAAADDVGLVDGLVGETAFLDADGFVMSVIEDTFSTPSSVMTNMNQ